MKKSKSFTKMKKTLQNRAIMADKRPNEDWHAIALRDFDVLSPFVTIGKI
ncbi:MAG: hypothetical protein LKE40_01040 [Spirochaetia bacterium]|jgi:hypothetical protein|nr:hypothetical protein [Spirochaetia bacterium]